MNNQKQNIEALKKAIVKAGSQQKLCNVLALNGMKITQGAVAQWLMRESVSFQGAYLINEFLND